MKYELIPCSWLNPLELHEFMEEVETNKETCNPLWEAHEIGLMAWRHKIGDLSMTTHEHYLAFMVDDELCGVCRITKKPKHMANGQIGLYIRPSMRGKMYAASFIRQIQEYCLRIGIEKPTACCDIKNVRAVKAFKNAEWIPTRNLYEWNNNRCAIELAPRK